ncbi:MAG: hypothetical protein IKM34_07120 [Clostridia bacterium]|nr:hypothetical protein [Clostridia bacterium]
MKKLLIVMVVALLAIALVACGGEETPTTTKGDATTPKAPAVTTPKDATTTPKDVTTTPKAPGTSTATTTPGTTTPATTAYVPPVQKEIEQLMDISWWDNATRKNLSYTRHDDGTMGYVWQFSMENATDLLPVYPEDHPERPLQPTLQLTTAEGARCFIKNMATDEDYKEYKVTNWRTQRHCDIWFEAEGFVPEPNVEYDMYIFFVSPEDATYPGELIYVCTLEIPWIYNPPTMTGNTEVDAVIDTAYQCQVHRHSKRWDISWPTDANAYDFDPATFPTMNFSWTYASDNTFPHLDGGEKAWQYINTENGFAYIRVKGSEEDFVRYDIDYMLLARHCDMWFTLDGFTPVENQEYEMVVFFMSGYGAAHPDSLHYCYADSWIAGPHE